MSKTTITMKDVAQKAGVSVMTVSRAFKSDSSIHDDTRDKIMAVAAEMGYIFDHNAANFRTQKTNFVAMTIPSINNANFADTVSAISKHLADAGMQLILGYSEYDVEREAALIEQLLQRRPEAMIVTGGHHSEKGRSLLERASIPVVEIWDLPDDPIDHVVGFSNGDATAALVEHIASLGMTKIAFLGGNGTGDTRGADRRRGFVKKMQALKLDASRLIDIPHLPMTMQLGASAMGELLESFPDTEAVITVSDVGAFGALTECQRRGVRVPDDIAIAGFGAFEISGVSVPTITTIDPQSSYIGQKAAESVLAALQEPESYTKSINRIEWHLKVGESTIKMV